ncbi:MAG: DNA phosphorothioation-dependent restriction protein DptG [Akkermansia sp.]|nr:DNA phosphorothioation-dependent restriction protein DptG [Akkermansia sp.]
MKTIIPDAYQSGYHDRKNGKFVDNFQSGIKILPFVSGVTTVLDKQCPLQGVSGEFFRLSAQDNTHPIKNLEKEIEETIVPYLRDEMKMEKAEIDLFSDILRDVLYISGNLNITDSTFLKYVPLMPASENTIPKEQAKREAGQRKAARYLYDMAGCSCPCLSDENQDLFSQILHDAFADRKQIEDSPTAEAGYTILPYIRKSFIKDLEWMLLQADSIKVRYLHLFFHFYLCYSVTQTIVSLSAKKTDPLTDPEVFYFILSSERVPVKHEAVEKGWPNKVRKGLLDKLYGHAQALDIANCILGGNVGFYPDVLSALQETPFEENKEALEDLLKQYYKEKLARLSIRKTEKNYQEISRSEDELEIDSYKDFLLKLEDLCADLQSTSYISRMRKKIIDLMTMRFLKRGRGVLVLSLDDEMFLFLTAMLTRGNKTKLEEVYTRFLKYGMAFNRETRAAMEQYLLKLNLLDRKSDAGEAQYVHIKL